MRVNAACKLRALGAALCALLLGGCPLPTRAPAPSPAAAAPRVEAETPAPHEGAPYDVIADESLLVIRAYRGGADRSEEHTSELQSQSNLVCRLLLEKKKQAQSDNRPAHERAPPRALHRDWTQT